MVLLANGGADVFGTGGSGRRPSSSVGVGALVGGRCLRTRYNRNIRCATMVVGQRSLVRSSRSARRNNLSPSERSSFGLLPHLGPRIRLKSRASIERRLDSYRGPCDT